MRYKLINNMLVSHDRLLKVQNTPKSSIVPFCLHLMLVSIYVITLESTLM